MLFKLIPAPKKKKIKCEFIQQMKPFYVILIFLDDELYKYVYIFINSKTTDKMPIWCVTLCVCMVFENFFGDPNIVA